MTPSGGRELLGENNKRGYKSKNANGWGGKPYGAWGGAPNGAWGNNWGAPTAWQRGAAGAVPPDREPAM